MVYRALADGVVLLHAAFVAFVMLGGFLAWRWRAVLWAHVPAALWGAAIEYAGWICPLTPLENALRARAGLEGYRGGFVEHYVIPLLYPAGLTRPAQTVLGTGAGGVNLVASTILIRRPFRGGCPYAPTPPFPRGALRGRCHPPGAAGRRAAAARARGPARRPPACRRCHPRRGLLARGPGGLYARSHDHQPQPRRGG